MNIHKVYL